MGKEALKERTEKTIIDFVLDPADSAVQIEEVIRGWSDLSSQPRFVIGRDQKKINAFLYGSPEERKEQFEREEIRVGRIEEFEGREFEGIIVLVGLPIPKSHL